MRLLLDTNIVLEVLLEQQAAKAAQALLARPSEHELYMSDYAVHSLGTILFRQKRVSTYQTVLEDLTLGSGVLIVSLRVDEAPAIVDAALRFGLDFDDAYQYVAAGKYGLDIVSFDAHFDRTERGRLTPADVLNH